MKTLCLSHVLSNDLSCYNNEKNILIEKYKNNEPDISLKGHCGTHIDFPLHMGGTKTLSDYKPSDFIFNSPYVIEVNPSGNYIQINDIKDVPNNIDFLIFKVKDVNERFSNEYALCNKGIDIELAKTLRLLFKNLKAIGINSISINAHLDKESGRKAHREFLSKKPEILIIEDMKLDEVSKGALKRIIVAPLLINGVDGVPVTIFAEVEE